MCPDRLTGEGGQCTCRRVSCARAASRCAPAPVRGPALGSLQQHPARPVLLDISVILPTAIADLVAVSVVGTP
jgi:hypothetical protein